MFIKKGAMFGLDARIALAIFGALSVISGASLYSAIEDSKSTALYTQVKEIEKVLVGYNLDMGSFIPVHSTYVFNALEIIENIQSSSLWKGPYIDCIKNGSSSDIYKYIMCQDPYQSDKSSVYIRRYADTTGITDACTSTDCYSWIMMHLAAADKEKYRSIFNILDEKYDNSTGEDSGSIKFYGVGSAVYLLFKHRAHIYK